jgi:prolyl-tRNA synthetase
MKFSNLHIKTYRDKPQKVESINADLLIRAGYIDQVMAGVYTYLPLGLRVLRKIENIIRDEMNAAGGQEIFMPALQPKENWVKTGRWETEDNLYKFTSFYTKTEQALGPTHEEIVMPLVKKSINSYRDLPQYVYQIQNKFRDEKRAKAGLLRGREFLMKDLYSFHRDETDLDEYYEVMKQAYINIYNKCGIGDKTYVTFASGGSFSKFSHEFQTVSESGEDLVYLCEKCKVAINKEVIDVQPDCPECGNKDLKEIKSIEVGNIFKNMTKYTETFDVSYVDEKGDKNLVLTGCYGIGLGRLMGAITEVSHDDFGIIWPKEVAPYQIILVSLGDEKVQKTAEGIYKDFLSRGIEIIWDDRDETAGVKLSDADLLGIPVRLVVSKKTLDNDSAEIKIRATGDTKMVKLDVLTSEITEVIDAK